MDTFFFTVPNFEIPNVKKLENLDNFFSDDYFSIKLSDYTNINK